MAPPYKPQQLARDLATGNWGLDPTLEALSKYGPKGTEGLNVGMDALNSEYGMSPNIGAERLKPWRQRGSFGDPSRSLNRAAAVADDLLGMDVPRGSLERLGKTFGPIAKKYAGYAGPVGTALGAGAAIALGGDRPVEESVADAMMGTMAPMPVGMGDRGKSGQLARDQADEFLSALYHGAGNVDRAGGMGGDSDLGGFMGPERPAKPVTAASFGYGKKGTRVRPTVPDLNKIDPLMEMLSAPIPTPDGEYTEDGEMDILSQLRASDNPMFRRVNGRVPSPTKTEYDMRDYPMRR